MKVRNQCFDWDSGSPAPDVFCGTSPPVLNASRYVMRTTSNVVFTTFGHSWETQNGRKIQPYFPYMAKYGTLQLHTLQIAFILILYLMKKITHLISLITPPPPLKKKQRCLTVWLLWGISTNSQKGRWWTSQTMGSIGLTEGIQKSSQNDFKPLILEVGPHNPPGYL